MIAHHALAQLCADLYQDDPADPKWAHRWDMDGIVLGHAILEGEDVIVFRGSLTALDWLRDVEGWPTFHERLGFVHAGFIRFMDAILGATSAVLPGPVVIIGHSLGGARARDLAALRAINGLPVTQLVTFGSPKPGFANLSRIIQKSGMIHASYRNCNDPVPLVPGILPLWEHPEPWIALNEHAAADDLEPLRDHHIGLYVRGCAAL